MPEILGAVITVAFQKLILQQLGRGKQGKYFKSIFISDIQYGCL
jgi:hypothetical protein